MPVRCFLAFAAMLCASRLQADTREVVRITANGQQTTFAQYRQGQKVRTENLDKNSSQPYITIRELEKNVTYVVDSSSRRYVEVQPHIDWILSLAQWITRPPRIRDSGKKVDVYYETIDTGERQQFFGHTTRHLLLCERHVAEPGACQGTYEVDRDGWYLPWHESGKAHLVMYYALIVNDHCRDTVVKHGDPPKPGFAVRETSGLVTREVLEFSNDPLDKSLFEVPRGFRKVDALPGYATATWEGLWRWEWAELERAVESWFE